jgi:tetratricopeptide (TPR) repeat protein
MLVACGDSNENVKSNKGTSEKTMQDAIDSKDAVLMEIKDLESKVNTDSAFDRTRALRLFRVYQDYYNQHPKDTVAGNYLFEAANLAQKLDKNQRAIELFINFHDGFRNSDRCDDAVYNVAYIYDAKLNDKKKAAEYYNKVIEMYPQSMWAEQARGALQILNMTDKELIEFLRQKNS